MLEHRRWTEDEIVQLRAMARKVVAVEIGRRMGRTRFSVQMMMRKLGLPGMSVGSRVSYTAEEDAAIRAGVECRDTAVSIGKRLGRSRNAVLRRMQRLGVKRPGVWFWTAEEDAQVRAAAGVLSVSELAEKLGRKKNSLWLRAARMGVVLAMRPLKGSHRLWSVEHEALLRELAPTETVQEIAARLGRGAPNVKRKANALGITTAVKARVKGESHVRAVVKASPVAIVRKVDAAAPKPAPRRDAVPRLAYCGKCGSPVMNTLDGWRGHNERVHGHPAHAASSGAPMSFVYSRLASYEDSNA